MQPSGVRSPLFVLPCRLQDTGTLQRSGNILMHLWCFDKSLLSFLSVIASPLLVGLCRFTKNAFTNGKHEVCIVQKMAL